MLSILRAVLNVVSIVPSQVLTIEAYRYFNESFSQSGQGSIEGPIEEYQEPDQNTDLQILGVDLDAKLVERSNENNPYPKNLTFRVADLMNETHRDGLIDEVLRNFSLPQFHLTMCFSVTLWIHLNHGDEGLKDFLRYISKISQFLLIEPQPWKCYRTAVRRMKKLNCEPFQHFPGLQWKEHVDEEILNFLITECGMVLKERYGKTEWDRTVCFLENKI